MSERHRGLGTEESNRPDTERENTMLFIGWDWASESHDVTVLDEDAATVDRWALGHDGRGDR